MSPVERMRGNANATATHSRIFFMVAGRYTISQMPPVAVMAKLLPTTATRRFVRRESCGQKLRVTFSARLLGAHR
jgi:hypothetical protein